MRFLTNGLKGREALLIDPARASDYVELSQKFGFTDMITKFFGEARKPVKIEGDGIVPISGVIGKRLSPIEKMIGSVDLDEVNAAIINFENDPEVERIVLDIDSPGGTVTGVEETANLIRSLSKPTLAYTDTEMASAAYWIGSAADRLVSSPSASVGSIGVFMAVPDFSKAYEDSGVKMVVIKSGKYKAAGVEGLSLTEEQLANFQEEIDGIHAEFKSAVRQKRRMARDEDMEGQSFSGKTAAGKGLVTGLADTIVKALRR